MTILNKIFNKLEYISSKQRIKIFKTIYINFRTLPFKTAIKFPISIYGKIKFRSLAGSIEIRNKVKRGMIRFGYVQGNFSGQKGNAMILLSPDTKLIFNGPCWFDVDCVIRITDKGKVDLGEYIGFGSDTKIYCEDYIKIGNLCRIPFGSTFMDTNYHYSINVNNYEVSRKTKPIIIGERNWIGNTCVIMKGTKTPEGTIIGSRSFLNKDYTKEKEDHSYLILAGSPAKVVGYDFTRILNLNDEINLNKFFRVNKTNIYKDNNIKSTYLDVKEYIKMFKY